MFSKKAENLLSINTPIIGMLHLRGTNFKEKLEIAIQESDILFDNGANAVLVENYFGTRNDVACILQYLCSNMKDRHYGINILGDYRRAFELAAIYGASFIQIDSVVGHLNPKDDEAYAAELEELRKASRALLLGGVRFKYKPILSGRSLEEDLLIGSQRCDIVVTTGEGTGVETDINKLKEFKRVLGDSRLIVGAGVTYDNCMEQLSVADGAIIGSYFKEGHNANNKMNPIYVKEIMGRVKQLRKR